MLKCKEELERHGVEVICNRETDVEIGLAAKVEQANNSGADIAVSFHANAGGGDGFEAYYYSTSANGKRLAGLCEKHVKAIGQNIRGLKSGDRLYFVKNTEMPAVLVEVGFLTNSTERTLLVDETYQSKIAEGIAEGIEAYFDENK